jgi:RNA polymerase sigma-70 factor (ECF subfamily)
LEAHRELMTEAMHRASATLGSGKDMPAPWPVIAPALASFDVVYDQCFEFVWRSALRLGVHEASVEDIVQEVFFIVHRKLPDFGGRSSLKTWLFSIVLHVVRHHRRSWSRKDSHQAPEMATRLEDLPDLGNRGPLEHAETADSVRLLDRLLRELGDDKREVFVLAHLEQMTTSEMAEVLGENVNTVYSRLRAARLEFEQALERHRARQAWKHGGSDE